MGDLRAGSALVVEGSAWEALVPDKVLPSTSGCVTHTAEMDLISGTFTVPAFVKGAASRLIVSVAVAVPTGVAKSAPVTV